MPVYPSGGTIAQSVGSPGFGPAPAPSYNASASVRFNPADTAYFSYTPTLQGSRTTWTWSGWVKRSGLVTGALYNNNVIFSAGASNPGFILAFDKDSRSDAIQVNVTRGTNAGCLTNALFRDLSAWYSIVLAFDTTQTTASNRLKLWVNNVEQTWFQTFYPNQNALYDVNSTSVHNIGRASQSSSEYFNGYIADVNFVDGLALTPSSFTATDANTGQLVPIQYTGNRGTNGFYLPLSGAALAVDLGQNPKTTGQDFPYWPYNTLLVNTTSTNGQQNNTFLDSSTNNFTVTRNGNTTQGNFTPFTFGGGTTQANGYYSGYFDGTGDYLNFTGNSALQFGTGDWTVEFWVNMISLPTQSTVLDLRGSASTIPVVFNVFSTSFSYYNGSPIYTSGITPTTNVWYHVAYVKSSGTTKIYVNGVSYSSVSDSVNYNTGTGTIMIGRGQDAAAYYFSGYISNLRVVKGTAVYTANFTVPTTPLTAIANTSLLTCQSSQFIDNSTNAFAITANGNSQPLPTNPFGMTAWSGYFDGSGDYLSVGDQSAFEFGSGNYTVELWWFATTSGDQNLIGKWDGGGSEWILQWRNAGYFRWASNGVVISDATNTLQLNTWNHIAASKSGTSLRIFLNGNQINTTATEGTISATSASLTIATAQLNTTPLYTTGWISNVRIVKGTAVYTANFTPPTAPLTAITGTSLLTCQSSTFVDNSTNAFPITVNGNSYTGTLNNPFNSPVNSTPPVQGWSAYNPVNASVDQGRGYITLPTSTNLALGAGDFSIEFWVNQNVPVGVYGSICGNLSATAGSFTLRTTTNSGAGTGPLGLVFGNTAGDLFTTGLALRLNQWHHVVVCRTSGTISCFVDGIRLSSVASTYNFSLGSGVEIFRSNTLSNLPLVGWLSNFRIVKGTSPYNAGLTTLTVPSGPLTAITGTQLLALQSNALVDNSPNRFPLTLVTVAAPGITPVTPVSPFIPTQAWSAASYGGTMYFDGTGDYLTVPSNAALELGTGDFTIEGWVYIGSGIVDNAGIVSKRSLSGFPTGNWRIAYRTGTGKITFANDSVNERGTPVVGINRWVHFAFSRKSGTIRAFADGVLGDTAADTVNLDNNETVYIGANTTSFLFLGYISGLRILKGTALYTTPFVPPVLPPTSISNTSLLLNATNSGIYDATGKNVIETVGNAQVSTAVKKWGTSSMYFDGSGDYLVIPPNIQNYLSGNQTTATNKDFTIEFWFYSVNTSINSTIFLRRASANPLGIAISQLANASLFFGVGDSGTGAWEVTYTSGTNAFTINTWNHIALTRQGTTYRFFLNGTQLYTAAPSAFVIAGDTLPMYIATNGTEASQFPFNGYIQDFRFTVGAARYQGAFTPPTAAFAYNQYDIGNQQWLPNNISVTAGVGKDNLVDSPSDYGTDTGLGGQVRGNYATMNPLRPASYGAAILTNGSLNAAQNTTVYVASTSTVGVRSGKWYWEVTCGVAGFVTSIGITSNLEANGFTTGMATYHYDGTKYIGATNSAYGAAYTNNDVIGFALDLDAGTLVCYKNGASQGTLISGLSGTYYAYTTLYGSNNVNFNFGQRAFSYTAPSGFKCLVSTNLPTVNGIGATSSTRADDYFNVVTWTGADTGTGRSISGLQFAPDLWWSKSRSTTYSHQLYDSVRGGGSVKSLSSDLTAAAGAGNSATYGYLSSFDPTGVTFTRGSAGSGTDPDGYAYYDQLSATYVAWAWRANGTGVANTAGTISSTVSANTTSGCSIVTYTGTGANATVGHGLGVAPSMVMVKQTSGTNGWAVYHVGLTSASYYLSLNSTDTQLLAATVWNGTAPTSSVFSIGTAIGVNTSSQTYVAYCFAPISGFSAMGSYTGNGSADGPMIYTGFRPAYVLIKRSSAVESWCLMDSKREGYNVDNDPLFPNLTNVEGTQDFLDLLSNGFKLRSTDTGVNGSGTYIYIAFAEFPFKYSRAR